MKKGKKKILVIIVAFLIIICLIVGIIFGFGFDKKFESVYSKLKNTSWGKASLEIYINDELVHVIKQFDDHPYIYVTKDQYVYCYTAEHGEMAADVKVACNYYNYDVKDDYISVYGLHNMQEEKLFYEFKNDDNTFVIKYGSEDAYTVETYNRSVG